MPRWTSGCRFISIHALREEGDRPAPNTRPRRSDFYPRPPRGGRLQHAAYALVTWIFLSTPSARRATTCFSPARPMQILFLSTPSARRATNGRGAVRHSIRISIHALREEGDSPPPIKAKPTPEFLSTPSARRATAFVSFAVDSTSISIHALREEGDLRKHLRAACVVERISIHALREEGDRRCRTEPIR